MKVYLHYACILLLFAGGCSSVEDMAPLPDPTSPPSKPGQPTLTATAPEQGVLGEPFDLDFAVELSNAADHGSLAVTILSGKASATLAGATMPLEGQWISLRDSERRIVIKPQLLGVLTLSLQAKSDTGITSEVKTVTIAVTAPAALPILRLLAPTQGSVGLPLDIDLEIESAAEGCCSLAAVLIAGTATASIQDAAVPLDGAWLPLVEDSHRMVVTPSAPGMLKLSFQLRTAQGITNTAQIVSIPIASSSPISAEASCQKTLINPEPGTRVPVKLTITKPGYSGTFRISVTQSKGQGRFFVGATELTGDPFDMEAAGTVDYIPQVVGDHAFEFSITAAGAEATTSAYVEVRKQIDVRCAAKECFTILGGGFHTTEGESVEFKIDDQGFAATTVREYGFEVAGWYTQDGELLTSDAVYTMPIHIDSPNVIELRLKPRTVTITLSPSKRRQYKYVYNGEIHAIYVYIASLEANLRLAEQINFNYQQSNYNFNTTPPEAVLRTVITPIDKGKRYSEDLWRIDNDFQITVHRADNPGLTFNDAGHYLESSSTKYILPDHVVFK